MFGKKKKQPLPAMLDLDGKPLHEGDIVESLRYDMGKCRILKSGDTYEYESLESGEKVSWSRMIDASSKNQKVKKIS